MQPAQARHLNLWKHGLGRVPNSTWLETNLETLVLADNELDSLSPQIRCLKRLRMLDVGHNRLTHVPDSIGDLDSLTDFLYPHDNRLTTLPASISRLVKLRYLNIGENNFESLPESVCEMVGLIELRVDHNKLTALPDAIGGLFRLRELHLSSTLSNFGRASRGGR